MPATMAQTDDVTPKIEKGVAATQKETNAPDFMSLVIAFSIASSSAEKIASPAITITYALGSKPTRLARGMANSPIIIKESEATTAPMYRCCGGPASTPATIAPADRATIVGTPPNMALIVEPMPTTRVI